MSFTKLEFKNFIDSTERGCTSQTQIGAKPGATQPVYIPKLMPYITTGTPKTETTVTTGNMIFKNASDCKPSAPNVVRTQNYISPRFESGASWTSIVSDPDEDPVPAGTNVHVTFASGNILSPTFNPG